jgi:hypothetical protein
MEAGDLGGMESDGRLKTMTMTLNLRKRCASGVVQL